MRYKLAKIKHPLLRGANSVWEISKAYPTETSPHTRGKRRNVCSCNFWRRFIPSCEGQTHTSQACPPPCMIHPLLRGADVSFIKPVPLIVDSSPPARGRQFRQFHKGFKCRFIPSCEGQTLSVYAAFSRLKHLVVQFAQMPFSTRHTSFSLHIIYRKNIFFAIFPNIFLYFFNPHSVFIVYNNFFTFTHTVIFCVYLYIFKDSCFRPAEILKIFNF